jgi:hypothetical protein
VRKLFSKTVAPAVAAVSLAYIPVAAQADDVGFGLGASYVFGSGFAVGVKAFSNDQDNETVGAVGIDYLIQAGAFRPNIGVAYQGKGYFSDANVGYNLGSGMFDFGLGAGASDSDDRSKEVPPAPAPASPFPF